MATPRMAVLMAAAFDVAEPVLPVGPELPVIDTGLALAVDQALPVSPVLVALD